MGRPSRRWVALATAALILSGSVLSGCTSAATTPSQGSAAGEPAASEPAANEPTVIQPSATEPGATKPSATTLEPPSAPADVALTKTTGQLTCPDDSTRHECVRWDLAWRNTSGPGTRFRIYEAWTGGEDVACAAVTGQAQKKVETVPNATTGALIDERVMGNGWQCVWVAAFNAAGQSGLVQVPGIQ